MILTKAIFSYSPLKGAGSGNAPDASCDALGTFSRGFLLTPKITDYGLFKSYL